MQKNWNADSLLDLGEFIASQKATPKADLVTEPQGASLRPVEVVPATAMFYDGRSTNSFKINQVHIPDTSVVSLPPTYLTRSAVMNWELNTAANMSQRFGHQLGVELDAAAGVKVGMHDLALESASGGLNNTFVRTADFCRAQQGLGPSMAARANANFASTALTTVGTVTGAAFNAATTFINTTNYVGRSMQIMNPPIRIDTKHSDGWTGRGTVSLRDGGTYSWNSKLMTGNPSIARNTTEWINTGFVHTKIRTEAITPSTWGLEKFALRKWPVEHYYDPDSEIKMNMATQTYYRQPTNLGTTTWKTTTSFSNYTTTTRGGVTTYTDHIRTTTGNINHLTNMPIRNYNFENPIIINTNKKY